MDKSAVWLERYRLLTEWANLARQQVECLHGGFEGERLESILHAKERLMVQLQALPDADPNCPEAANAFDAAETAYQLELQAEELLREHVLASMRALADQSKISAYLQVPSESLPRFLDRYK